MLELAGGDALFFVLDLHNQILASAGMFALVAAALMASAVGAIFAAASVTKKTTEKGTFGEANLLAGVGVTPLFDLFGLSVGNADAVVGAPPVAAATAWTTGLHNGRIVRQHSAGLQPDANNQSAQGKGE
jgi:hypothetical protein